MCTLMVKPVDRIVPDFAAAGATYISFHPEAVEHVDRTIELIREQGCKPGLVFNPATPLDYLDYTLDKLDLVLIMSVNPGFGGQKFIPTALRKLREARERIDASGRDVRLEIDGGVKVDNIGEIARAGARTCSSRALRSSAARITRPPSRRCASTSAAESVADEKARWERAFSNLYSSSSSSSKSSSSSSSS